MSNPLSRVWRFRIFVLFVNTGLVVGIIWMVSRVGDPPPIDQQSRAIPLHERVSIPKYVAGGNDIFHQYCVACHGPKGEGGTGPALNDEEWLHGSSMDAIVKSVAEGHPTKGMVGWKPVLGDAGVEQVSVYVFSLSQPDH